MSMAGVQIVPNGGEKVYRLIWSEKGAMKPRFIFVFHMPIYVLVAGSPSFGIFRIWVWLWPCADRRCAFLLVARR